MNIEILKHNLIIQQDNKRWTQHSTQQNINNKNNWRPGIIKWIRQAFLIRESQRPSQSTHIEEKSFFETPKFNRTEPLLEDREWSESNRKKEVDTRNNGIRVLANNR